MPTRSGSLFNASMRKLLIASDWRLFDEGLDLGSHPRSLKSQLRSTIRRKTTGHARASSFETPMNSITSRVPRSSVYRTSAALYYRLEVSVVETGRRMELRQDLPL